MMLCSIMNFDFCPLEPFFSLLSCSLQHLCNIFAHLFLFPYFLLLLVFVLFVDFFFVYFFIFKLQCCLKLLFRVGFCASVGERLCFVFLHVNVLFMCKHFLFLLYQCFFI